MTKKLLTKTSFNSGELSPRLYSRIDVSKYANGLNTALNCFVVGHGPVIRRNGSQYIASAKNAAKKARLLKFQFSITDALILEVGDLYIRFFKDQGVVGAPYELVSPYTEAQLDDIVPTQIGNIIYLAHPSHETRKLTRITDGNWSIATLDPTPPPTYEAGLKPTTTITPGATTGLSISFTAGAAVFLEGDVGRQIKNLVGTGRASIISISSSTLVICDIVEDFPSTSAIASQDWVIDLSPVTELEPTGSAAGSIITLRSTYPSGTLGTASTITAITKANPAVVTTSAAHGLSNGQKVVIKDVIGMTDLNDAVFIVDGATATTFQLKSTDTTNSVTYNSQGTAQQVLTDIIIPTFRSGDIGKYILLNGGVVQVISTPSNSSAKAEVLKSLTSEATTGNWSMEVPAWDATRGWPKATTIFQQRLVLAGTTAQPQTVWLSETGIFDGFGVGADADDSLEIDLNASHDIKWAAAARTLIIGTAGSEVTIEGSSTTSALTPDNIGQVNRTSHGGITQTPVLAAGELLFIQNSQKKLRSFNYDFNTDGYKSEDLTFLAEHITSGLIKELAYAKEPDSQIICVTEDGSLLVGTFIREQEVMGWTKYTTDGTYESVQTIENGSTSEVWVVVKRTVNGSTVRYIELFDNSTGEDNLDSFSDSFLTYSAPKAITGATAANPVVITATAHGYVDGDKIKIIEVLGMTELNNKTYLVANKTTNTFELTDVSGNNINGTAFTAYSSGGEAHKLVTVISGLSHLEGKSVQLRVDGASHPNKTVTSGSITLDKLSYEVVAGLPYTTTITTLEDTFDVGLGPMVGQRTRWVRPILRVYKSAKPALNGSFLPARSAADEQDLAVPLYSGDLIYGPLDWSTSTQVTITFSDPLPLMITGLFGSIEGGSI
jgi:hypothetical protein